MIYVCRMPQELTKQTQTTWSERESLEELEVWRYFTLNTPTSSMAVCNVCKANVARGGRGSTVNYNTTNLIKHLQKYHATEQQEFQQLNRLKGAGGRPTTQQLT